MAMGERILIVDDELSTLRLLGMALEREGYVISAAQDAPKALAQIEASLPDLIILDVMLPGASGLEFCAQLRQRADTAATPILMLSAKGQVADKIAGLQAGADEYIVKPIDTSELVVRVASLVERTRRVRTAGAAKVGRVSTIIGAKGGVGTTTLLVNLGVAIAYRKVPVVAAELRPYPGSMSILTGLHAQKGLAELLEMPPRAITTQEVERRLAQHASGMRALCPPSEILQEAVIEPEQAEAILHALAGLADHILVDVPPGLTPATRVALQQSGAVFLLVEPVRDSVETGRLIAKTVRDLAGAGAALALVVVSRAPIASPMAPSEVEERVGWEIVAAIPPAADQCALAQQKGIPLVQLQPEAVHSQVVKRLAERFS